MTTLTLERHFLRDPARSLLTEEVGSAVKLPNFIREVKVSNLDRDIGYPDSDFSWNSKVLPEKLPQIRPRPLDSKSSCHPTLCSLKSIVQLNHKK